MQHMKARLRLQVLSGVTARAPWAQKAAQRPKMSARSLLPALPCHSTHLGPDLPDIERQQAVYVCVAWPRCDSNFTVKGHARCHRRRINCAALDSVLFEGLQQQS